MKRGKYGALLIFFVILSFGTFLAVLQVSFVHSKNSYFYSDGDNGLMEENSTIVLWWSSFGSQDETKICGNSRCYFTRDRMYASRKNLKKIHGQN
ncbi:hypothetical protein KM043_014327 [Ampulex compressa]|nr:hypothetical protein KM043_014327 [Ampulex compressa]